MKKNICLLALTILLSQAASAQQLFIEKATVEYEVKTNIKKKIGDGTWAEMMKENLSTFSTAYFHLTFANNKSIYKLNHFNEKEKVPEWMKRDEEESEWYTDHSTATVQTKKMVVGASLYVKDSLPAIEWKLVNENMNIAGFNCRKAVGKIFDSVYVFAFYTEEIPISSGPCSVAGLPGLVMAMTIPRLYTSWVATKVMVNGVNESIIKPAEAKKTMLRKEFRAMLLEKTKDNGNDEESKQWIDQFLWNAQL
ncbi:MAG: hypothetical protein RL172_438 [Bacteroidota bacterium]|jgi:GLPGLI family protein